MVMVTRTRVVIMFVERVAIRKEIARYNRHPIE